MYQQPPAPVDSAPAPRRWQRPRVPANVWAIGATSLLTDISSEMVTSVLPLYVVLHLQMTPLAFGALDGLYQGVAAAVRMGSGVVADRFRRHKVVALVGYALSAGAKAAYITAGAAWPAFLAVVTADRLGKGIRTAPRDALIAASARPGETATAFGVHRAMDAAGATIGPLTAFAVLMLAPGRFDQVFVVSFAMAVVGVAALWLFVDAPGGARGAGAHARARPWAQTLSAITAPRFRAVLFAAGAVSIASVTDGLLYLVLQRQFAFDPARITLLFVGTPLCYFLLAGPFGVVADRLGTARLFIAGHISLLAVYGLLSVGVTTAAGVAACLLCLGAYYAATDGILAAMAASALPADDRATGLGLLATCTTAGRGLAAVAFGALWTYASTGTALAAFAALLVAGIGVSAWQLGAARPLPPPAEVTP
jgi:Major Facilitator Superfamily